jgi:hypothetical protein
MHAGPLQVTWDINISTLLLLSANFVGLIWFAFVTSVSARAALRKANHAQEQIASLAAVFSAHREQIAKDYISREVMHEVEDRMSRAIDNLARISAESIERLGARLDRVFDERRHREVL